MTPTPTTRFPAAALLAAAAVLLAAGCGPAARHDADVTGRGGKGGRPALALSPDPAYANARLAAVFTGVSPDPAACRYEWRRNGDRLWGANGPELDPANFHRGDRIAVRVIEHLPDGDARVWMAETKVINTPPQVTSVALVMESGEAGAELRASVNGVDPDGDPVRWTYAWTRNGESLEGASGATLPAAGLARGDRVAVTVTGADEDAVSSAVASDPFLVENRPPAFTSRPPALRRGDAAFEYLATAVDPDGDPLRYELVRGPAGATVSPDGGVRWALPGASAGAGDVTLVVRASDPAGGTAEQQITIRLSEPVAAR